jgi:hypothetical protein
MSEERMNKHPEFLQETMFAEHGTKVLITNPRADKYLKSQGSNDPLAADRNKEKYAQWEEDTEPEN